MVSKPQGTSASALDDGDGEWQEMPIVRSSSPSFGDPFDPTSDDLDESDSDSDGVAAPGAGRRRSSTTYRRKILGRKGTAGSAAGGYRRPSLGSVPIPSSPAGHDKPKGGTTGGGPGAGNATGDLIDFDDEGHEWREKKTDSLEEGAYTRLRLDEDVEEVEMEEKTDYLFRRKKKGRRRSTPPSAVDGVAATGGVPAGKETGEGANSDSDGDYDDDDDDDLAPTPISQMRATKDLLTEGQRVAYVGLCKLCGDEMVRSLMRIRPAKDLDRAIESAETWAVKVMARLYQHMDIDGSEQKMIESLADHGVQPEDLSPSLVTTRTVPNPSFDPQAAREKEGEEAKTEMKAAEADALVEPPDGDVHPETETETAGGRTDEYAVGEGQDEESRTVDGEREQSHRERRTGSSETAAQELTAEDPSTPAYDDLATPRRSPSLHASRAPPETPKGKASDVPNEAVSTSLNTTDENLDLDIRWTILCDLFLVLTADSVYDARSRVLLERVAERLDLTWMDVVKFEKRVTDALEIQEGIERMSDEAILQARKKAGRNKRFVMMGLATVGGGLVIGLSAGLLAPVIGAGLAAAAGGMGIAGTSAFFGGVGGAAVITSTGALTGSGLAAKGMMRRTRYVKTFEYKPLHNNKRVNCIVTMGGFLAGKLDDPRLPYSVIDPLLGDVFSVLWEPDMMREMGNAMGILWSETLSQVGQQVLQATVMTGLMSALAWPLVLTKLSYLIDNPWSNALDRAKAAGLVLADTLMRRHLGVRPITLVGFSLGARAIFYALCELERHKAFGIIQNVYLMGAAVTANTKTWRQARSVVAGRFVNCYARNDWILGYLYRATSGGFATVAGLRPVELVPDIENVDITDLVPGHLAYRSCTPSILEKVGFRVTADYFDEPEDLVKMPEREVVRPGEEEVMAVPEKKGIFSIFRKKKKGTLPPAAAAAAAAPTSSDRPGSGSSFRENSVSSDPKASGGFEEYDEDEDDLPPRLELAPKQVPTAPAPPAPSDKVASPTSLPTDKLSSPRTTSGTSPSPSLGDSRSNSALPPTVHFDTDAMLEEIRKAGIEVKELESSLPPLVASAAPHAPSSDSSPPPASTSAAPQSTSSSLEATISASPSPSPHGKRVPELSSRSMSYDANPGAAHTPITAENAWVAPSGSSASTSFAPLSGVSSPLAPATFSAWGPTPDFSASSSDLSGPSLSAGFGTTLAFGTSDGDIDQVASVAATPPSYTSSYLPAPSFASSPLKLSTNFSIDGRSSSMSSAVASPPALTFGGTDGSLTWADQNGPVPESDSSSAPGGEDAFGGWPGRTLNMPSLSVRRVHAKSSVTNLSSGGKDSQVSNQTGNKTLEPADDWGGIAANPWS